MAYLGLLPASLITLRWAGHDNPALGLACILVTIFTTKCCDIGAYFTGRFFGRHRMTPVLSPKKTWEGLSGGLVLSTLVSLLLWRLAAGLTGLEFNPLWAAGFGLTVGLAGSLSNIHTSLACSALAFLAASSWQLLAARRSGQLKA